MSLGARPHQFALYNDTLRPLSSVGSQFFLEVYGDDKGDNPNHQGANVASTRSCRVGSKDMRFTCKRISARDDNSKSLKTCPGYVELYRVDMRLLCQGEMSGVAMPLDGCVLQLDELKRRWMA